MASNDSQTKSLKDLKEYDFENVELLRGQTPHDINERCLRLCKDYLGHNWIQQTVHSIHVRRITGGLSNQLYYCGVNEPSLTSTAPQEVAIRLYGIKGDNHLNSGDNEIVKDRRSKRLSDVIASLILSEVQLGPKIYGLFDEGQIQRYYEHRQFKLAEQNHPKLVEELFRKIARVHALDVPLPRKSTIFAKIDRKYREAYRRHAIHEMIDELNCETIKGNDLAAEVQWLKAMSVRTDSPIVFSHNDMFSSNILVLDNETVPGGRLVFCDFEFASYGFRGHDLGTVISEWGRLWTDFLSAHTFANDSVIKQLVQYYVSENEIIFGKSWSENRMNSVEQLLKEVKLFALVYKISMILFCLKTDTVSDDFPMDPKFLMKVAENEYKNYWRIKTTFIQQNAFD